MVGVIFGLFALRVLGLAALARRFADAQDGEPAEAFLRAFGWRVQP